MKEEKLMVDIPEWAMKRAGEIFMTWIKMRPEGVPASWIYVSEAGRLIREIAAALVAVRREVLEEAAQHED